MVLTIKEETVPPWDYRGALSPGTGPDLPGWPAAAPSWVRVPLLLALGGNQVTTTSSPPI